MDVTCIPNALATDTTGVTKKSDSDTGVEITETNKAEHSTCGSGHTKDALDSEKVAAMARWHVLLTQCPQTLA